MDDIIRKIEQLTTENIPQVEDDVFLYAPHETYEWEYPDFIHQGDYLIVKATCDIIEKTIKPQYTGEDWYYDEETVAYSLSINSAEYYPDPDSDECVIYHAFDFDNFNNKNDFRVVTR